MKKVLNSILIIMILFILSGCTIKNENNMKIKSSREIDFTTTIAFDREILSNIVKLEKMNDNIISDVTEDEMINYLNENINSSFFEGFKQEKYIEDDFIGITYKYTFESIDDLLSDNAEKIIINDYSSNNKIKDLKLFYKYNNIYNANYVFKSLDSLNNDESITYHYLFTLTLPNKSENNNADNVTNNGKTLIWKLDNNEDNLISFSFKFLDYKYPLYLIIIILIIILLLMFIIIKFKMMKIINLINISFVFILISIICIEFNNVSGLIKYNVNDTNNKNILKKSSNTLSIDTQKLSSSLNSISVYFNQNNYNNIYNNSINNIINNNKFTYNDGVINANMKENDANILFSDYYDIDDNINVIFSLDDIDEYDYSNVKENILRKKIVETAQKQIGNDGWKYLKWYGLNYNAHWCAIFISWVANENGLLKDNYFPKFAWVKVGVDYYKSKNQFKYSKEYTPKPGDVIFFNWNNNDVIDHVGIVEKIDGNKVYTIEGNVNRKSVKRREYSLNSNYIYGYGIPNYSK